MKTFLAVLAALIVAFFVGRYILAHDANLAQWQRAKNECMSEIQASFDRAHELASNVYEGNALEVGGQLYQENKRRRNLLQTEVELLDHKPGELTDREEAELKDAKATLVEMDKPPVDENATPTPVPVKATPVPTPLPTFAQQVKASQLAAVKRYPQLGVKGSALNSKFLQRLAQWQSTHDPRFRDPNWPERLADECMQQP